MTLLKNLSEQRRWEQREQWFYQIVFSFRQHTKKKILVKSPKSTSHVQRTRLRTDTEIGTTDSEGEVQKDEHLYVPLEQKFI